MRRLLTIFIGVISCIVASAQDFNIETKLKGHVGFFTSDFLEGRKAGSAGERAAADYIYEQFMNAGLLMLTDDNGQDFSIEKDNTSINSRNIVGMVEGYDSKLKNEYIVVGAHYDALGTNELSVDGNVIEQVYRGADDNASGVSMLIELANMVAQNSFMFPRSIIFIAFGASEEGMAGSWYFVNRAFENIANVKAMIDMNMLGRGDKENPFQIFSQATQGALADVMNQTEVMPVVVTPKVATSQIVSSDYLSFYDKKIPVVLFTTGMTREYHSLKDTPELLQYYNMERETNYLFYFLQTLSIQENILPELNGKESSVKSNDQTLYSLTDCDVKPQFFHADESHFLKTWVYKYVKYPSSAVKNGIQGKVYVSFVIEKDGKVSNVEVVQGLSDDLDDEAVKVVSISPKWTPGEIRGRKVRTRIVLPIEFRLKR